VDQVRRRWPRLLAVLANVVIVVSLVLDDFLLSFRDRALPHQSVLTEVTSLLQAAGLLLLAYVVWSG
jgi:hypothetical protein